MLNLKHYAFPPTLTPSKGARILVHPPNQVPDMGDNAMSLYPGASTSLAIEQVSHLPLAMLLCKRVTFANASFLGC